MFLVAALPAQADLQQELESVDLKRVAAARKQVLELPAPERVDLLRKAIWSKAPQAAVWSANSLKYDQVDLREAARVVDLLLPEVGRQTVLTNDDLDFDNFRQLLGSTELPRLFAHFPSNREHPSPGAIMTQIHRQFRAEHIPALCRLAMNPDPRVTDAVLDDLIGATAPRTNRYRNEIGLALLHRIKVKVPASELDKKRDGYPLVLHRCLENFGPVATLQKRQGDIHDWIWRWARDEKAGLADRDVLLKLLESESEQAWSIAVHGLADFVDQASQQKLGDRCEATENINLRHAIFWALARRGTLSRNGVPSRSVDADHALWRASATSSLALGLYWQLHPKKGASRFYQLLFDADPDRRKVALRLCTGDTCEFALAGLRVRREWFEGLPKELPDAGLPGRYLAQLVANVPGMRRVDLAKQAIAQADLKKPRSPQHDMVGFLAFLEIVAPKHLRSLLATWAASDDKDVRNHARKLQLRIGDETAVNELVAVLDKEELDDRAPLWLARIKASKVEEFLRRRVRTEDGKLAPRYLHALAVHYGLPESVGFEGALPKPGDPVFAKARRLVLDKKPIDALVCVLESLGDKDREVKDLGLVSDPRITRYLEQTRKMRYLGLYAWATSQLALQGDTEARKEFWQGCLLGRYRWIDNSDPRALTLNFDLDTIPFWLSELETNCCRRNIARWIFERLFGLDLLRDNRVFPEVVQAREFWKRHRSNLRWSRIKWHYVPGPDR